MTNKKVSEMNFKEFVEEGKATNNPSTANVESEILAKLRKEGLTDKEIYELPMPKAWDLYLAAMINELEKDFSNLALTVEKNPNLYSHPAMQTLYNVIKKASEDLEKQDKGP